MNILSYLLVCVLSFLLGIILGFLSKNLTVDAEQTIVFNEQPIVYEISEKQNCEYRNFLNYDGSEQN